MQAPVPSSFDSIMYRYIHEYEIALFWWAFRVAFYWVLTREIGFYLLPAILKSCKTYVESFFPKPLVDIAEAVAEGVLDELESDVDEAVDAAADAISAASQALLNKTVKANTTEVKQVSGIV